VLLQPVFQCEPLKGRSELVIDLGPCSPKFGCRKWIGKHSVRIRDIRIIQLGVEPLAETEQRKHAIVNGGQMAEYIEDPVLTRSDLLLELFISGVPEGLIKAANDELP
jgi:hypothetical protein